MRNILLSVVISSTLLVLAEGWLFWGKKKEKDRFNVNDVTFHIYTRSNRAGVGQKLINMGAIRNKGFVSSKPTTFITHGWKSHSRKTWIQTMKNNILNVADHNVFIVDWSTGADRDNYKAAVKNTRVTGSAIYSFIRGLERYGLSPGRVHMIGHSLGGHCSAEAGRRIKNPKLRRISGLDVPDLGFDLDDPNQTLDPSDADFVDETHTQLSWTSKGHVDFYPNGGLQMPGCKKLGRKLVDVFKAILDGGFKEASALLRCDHEKAASYYIESITSTNCNFTARACSGWDDYKDHKCDSRETNEMGYYAKPQQGTTGKRFYLRTNSHSPYCKRQLA